MVNDMENLFDNISEWSYQRYARFYGDIKPSDDLWNNKISKIYNLIINEKEEDLEFIAKESGCSFTECVMKIRYLKNKRKIGDYYIDLVTKTIKKCSPEDEKKLVKYIPYIYNQHLQIKQIAAKMPGASVYNLDQMANVVYNELLYLDEKGLLNGVVINQVDRTIVYYSVEKHKGESDKVTINCRNCGAINDVNRHSKVRCAYCKSIVEDK